MQLKWLEDLVALAEAGNLALAARRRHVTHPAFGRRIRALETWAGAPLVDRSTSPMRLTPEGEALLEAGRDAIAALASARKIRDDDDHRPVHIATGRTLARTLVPTWYAALQGRLAQRQLKVTTHSFSEVSALLQAGSADFMLTYYHPTLALQLHAGRFTHLTLAEERLLPVSACGQDGALHTLSRRHTAPWLSYSSVMALGRLVSDHLAGHLRPPRLRCVVELDSADAMHEFALRGMGIAWLPHSMVVADLRQQRLHQLGDRSHEIRLEVRLYRPKRRLSALAESLWADTAASL